MAKAKDMSLTAIAERAERRRGMTREWFEAVRLLEEENPALAHEHGLRIVERARQQVRKNPTLERFDMYYRALLFMAPHNFDCYCQYIEKERDGAKRFYVPRRKAIKPIVDQLQRLADGELDLLAVSCPPGIGKAVANDTPVLTRNGFKKHGDLIVGDEVVAPNGEFARVTAVHPKCEMEYVVTFANHERIICHGEHIWTVYNRWNRKTEQLATKDMIGRLESGGTERKRGHRYMFSLPQREIMVGVEKELPVDPYSLGVWLGDGVNRNPTVANARCDKAIIDNIPYSYSAHWTHKTTGVDYYYFPELRRDLQKVGMCHSRKTVEKYIPEEYLTASVAQRLELLAGLLDTDGYVGKNCYYFSTVGKKLRDGFAALVSTFGWRYSLSVQEPCVSSSGIVGRKPVYTIKFFPSIEIPCVLKRKRVEPLVKRRRIAIVDISPVRHTVEGNCITVVGGEYCIGKTMLPTHNSTLAIFYMTWLAGREPDKPILGMSHSNAFLGGVYDECLQIMDKKGDYRWCDVFPDSAVTKTNAKDMMINIDAPKRFTTLEFSSIGSGNAGKVRAENLLYCDDLCEGIEQAMSRDRLDSLWQKYTDDARQRKIRDCRELHIATRWSVHDVIGRLERAYEGNPRAEFLSMPATDEDGHSNFTVCGFSDEFYAEQKSMMDDASWRALYMNEPIEREGQLYIEDELRRYFELPDGEPDAILAVCDTKDRGNDYCVMPIAYQYGKDFYIDKIICDNGEPGSIEARLIAELVNRKVHLARFESNAAGGKIAEKVQEGVKQRDGRCKITTKFTSANKETKIMVNAPWVKEHCLFREGKNIDSEYRAALRMLCGYTLAGRNKHDDVPDAFAMLAEFAESLTENKVYVFQRPW